MSYGSQNDFAEKVCQQKWETTMLYALTMQNKYMQS